MVLGEGKITIMKLNFNKYERVRTLGVKLIHIR